MEPWIILAIRPAAHAARSIQRDIQHTGAGDQSLVLLVELEVDGCLGEPRKRHAADERGIIAPGKGERCKYFPFAKPNRRTDTIPFPYDLDDFLARGRFLVRVGGPQANSGCRCLRELSPISAIENSSGVELSKSALNSESKKASFSETVTSGRCAFTAEIRNNAKNNVAAALFINSSSLACRSGTGPEFYNE
ncbi:MAG: hypothetical protein IPM25_05990 [Chloracidobacterium sp.]|nr:hypothetical protein [Chloracidobacterium sp.]